MAFQHLRVPVSRYILQKVSILVPLPKSTQFWTVFPWLLRVRTWKDAFLAIFPLWFLYVWLFYSLFFEAFWIRFFQNRVFNSTDFDFKTYRGGFSMKLSKNVWRSLFLDYVFGVSLWTGTIHITVQYKIRKSFRHSKKFSS
jgi:hypothetical protein